MSAGWVLLFSVLGLAGIAVLPLRLTRLLGALLLGGAFAAALRLPFGNLLGAGIGLGVAFAAWRSLPLRVLRRVAFVLPSMIVLVLATTWLMYLAPGSPFAQERTLPPQVEAALRAQYGVPETPLAFFAVYTERLLVHGSMGPSLKVQGRSVTELLLPALPVSLTLGAAALLLALLIGLALGVRAGLRPGARADHGSMALALVGVSVPNFVIGAGLLAVFALWLGWLPVARWGGPQHLVLPALTLALPHAAYIARLARSGTIDAMQRDFIRTARAKGLSERQVVVRHALPSALTPVGSYLGPAAAGILTGSFVVETLFAIPGMGQWFVKGAINRDYSMVLGTAVLYFGLVSLLNLLVDLAYAWLDPRLEDEA